MKKILIVCDLANGSGLTEFVFNVFSHFNLQEYAVTVVGYGNKHVQETDKRATEMGWKVYRSPLVSSNPIKHWKFWKKFFKQHTFDIAYFNYSSSWNFLPIVYAKKSNISQVVCHSHNSYFSHQFNNVILNFCLKILNKIGRIFINKYSDIKIATSRAAAKWMFGKKANDVNIIKNGVNIQNYLYSPAKRAQLRNEINVNDNTCVIGFVGALVPRKNPLFALKVFKAFLKEVPDSVLAFIGDGQLKNSIKQESIKLGISDRVKLIGYSSEVNHWYSAFDAFIFPSLFEGFGLVAVEAQISNLPVIISNTVPKEVLVNKNTKQLSIENGVNIWVEKLVSMVKNVHDRNKFNNELNRFASKLQAKKIIFLLMNKK